MNSPPTIDRRVIGAARPPGRGVAVALSLAAIAACSDLRESPTAAVTIPPVPAVVRILIDANCTFCHRPDAGVFPGGQEPWFTTEAELQRSRRRIAVRIQEGTMPRDGADPFGASPFRPLAPAIAQVILEWADTP